MAFEWAFNLSGGAPTILSYVVKDTVVLSRGEFVNLETGEVDTAATADTALVGITAEAKDNTADGLSVKVIMNPDAVYAVDDANARVAGATLDIAAGALGVAASANADFIVLKDSTASEKTLVTFNGNHYLDLS